MAGLALAPASISENGGIATVTATLSGASSVAATVTVATAAVASSGAVAGDFTQTGTLLTIAAGATVSTGLVTVTGADNDVDAANKTVTVSGTASGGHGVAAPANATLTLADDEATPTAALVLMPASISENGGLSTVTATLSHPTTEATTLTVAAAAVSPAVSGDFTLSSTTTLTLAAGATTSTGLVTVTANNNAVASGSKQVRVSATAAGGRGVANPSNATLALRDDDYGLVESAVSGQATEAGGQATFTVRLRSLPTAAVTVTVTSRDTTEGRVSAGGGAPAASTTLTFTTGSWNTAQTVTVTGVDDAVDDGTVTWTVRLAPSSGDTSYGALSAVDVPVTTTDDDTARAALVLTPASILENGEVSTVTATLSHATTEAVTLTVAAAAGSGAVAADFTLSTTTTLTLATGATTSTGLVTVTANDNSVASADKSVTVSATAAGGRGMAAPPDVTLTLRDDEATADVNGDGAVNANDGLLMYYAYTFETVFKLENDLGRRVRGFLRTLRGPGSPAADDAGYKAMLQAAWDWRSAGTTAGDVNGDGSIGAKDGLLMYYAYTFEAVFKLENDLGRSACAGSCAPCAARAAPPPTTPATRPCSTTPGGSARPPDPAPRAPSGAGPRRRSSCTGLPARPRESLPPRSLCPRKRGAEVRLWPGIVRDDAGEDQRSHPVVVQERPEAGGGLTVVDQALLVEEQQRTRRHRDVVDGAQTGLASGEDEHREHRDLARADEDPVGVAEQDGGRLDPDLHVVFPIDHRIHGVVGHGPGHGPREQQPRQRRHLAGQRRERHRDPPSEGNAEVDLRQVRPSLHERIARGQRHGGEGVQHREPVQGEDQSETEKAQPGEHAQRLGRRDLAARDGPVHRAPHVGIDLAVREVVDDASGRAHDEHPGHEHEHHGRVRPARPGDPQRPQGRPQQQQGADRLVHAHQQRVLAEAFLHVRRR